MINYESFHSFPKACPIPISEVITPITPILLALPRGLFK